MSGNPTNEHVARVLAAHGVPKASIERLLQARSNHATTVRSYLHDESNPAGSEMNNEGIQMIQASLREVGGQVKAFKEGAEQQLAETSARLSSLEQAFAQGEVHRGGGDYVPGVGSSAAEKFQEDAAFSAAAETAGRGMKPSQFSARVNVDSSIRAALTNEGAGQTGDTSVPGYTERRGTLGPVLRPLRLLSVLPSRPTSANSVEFVQLNATGDAAEQIKEGDEKAEIEFSGVLRSAHVVTIAAHTTASKQVLADQAALGQQIDRVIRHKVFSRLEDQIINGPGGEGRINGLLNQSTTFAPSIGETPADRIGEALVTMANEGYLPDLVLMNPMDWFRIQLTRKNDTDDEYVFGSPTMPVPPSLWNSRIVTNPSLAAGTGMVIDTSFTTVLDREQMSVSATNTHADYFIRNLVKILGELRAGLEVLDVNAVRKFDLTPAAP